jgi:hypothetical protein
MWEKIVEAVKHLVSGKSGDHLPVTKDGGSPDHRLMGAAWAALHGGYRGKTYEGPDKAKAITKLTAMYKAAGMDTPSESWAAKGQSLNEADVMASAKDSYDAVRCAIGDQINDNIKNGMDMDCDDDGAEDASTGQYAWVMDVFPMYAVYSMEGNTFMVQWHRDANDKIVLGEPFPVQQSWVTVDAPFPQDDEEQESLRVAVSHLEQLRESAYNKTNGELTIRVIQPGFNKAKTRMYPSETLKRDFGVFKGAKMFVDHQTEAQEEAQPEGSVHNWVATLNNVWCEEDGTIMGTAAVIDPGFKTKLETLADKNLLTEMGVSIRAIGEATTQESDGHEYRNVESFLAARSVDFVTYAGAGGAVLAIESSSLVDENDVDLMSVATFRTRRPDIVSIIEKQTKETIMKSLEVQLKEAQDQLKAANDKLAAQEKAAKIAEANAGLTKLLSESKLPEVAVNRMRAQFKDATTTDGMKEAITAEVDYIKSLTPVAKHNGADDNGTVTESDNKKVNLEESFALLGLPAEQCKIAAKR